jgi:hypothetical protein
MIHFHLCAHCEKNLTCACEDKKRKAFCLRCQEICWIILGQFLTGLPEEEQR